MRISKLFAISILPLLVFLLTACSPGSEPDPEPTEEAQATTTIQPCIAQASWVTDPNPPQEIGNGTPVADQTNCQFYQFGWEWFLALVQSTGDTSEDERVFETLPVYTSGQTNQCANLQGGREALARNIFVRTGKDDNDSFNPVVPAEVAQASGANDILYDQNGNIVFYTVQFNETECENPEAAGFQPGTMELKVAWKQISEEQKSDYLWLHTEIEIEPGGTTNEYLLGMVGFHLVRNTATHPEFMWATFEHKSVCPNCTNPQEAPAGGWDFTSASCAESLANGGTCDPAVNTTTGNTGLTNPTPTEVCRLYPDGVGPELTDNNIKSRANIDTLNQQLVGPEGYVTQLPSDDPMAVIENYFLAGGIWTNEGTASTPANQRGSLKLANTTMETFVQESNCFSCHNYNPNSPRTVSHIWNGLKPTS